MCGKRAAAAVEGGGRREREKRWRKGELSPASISSRGPRYSGLMGLQRSEKHRRVAAVVSVTLVIYWANFLPPPSEKKRQLVWVESRRQRLARPAEGIKRDAGQDMRFVCAQPLYT